MKLLGILAALIIIQAFPAFAQEQKNPSVNLVTFEIPFSDFNVLARDTLVIELEQPHSISWQIIVENELVYNNPNGNAVVRFYDLTTPEKFIEIGMGSQPDRKFWLAALIPDDTGYVVVHSKQERGWIPGALPTLSYTEKAGLTVNNGERIVLSNLDVGSFQIASYSVHGMEASQDPPPANSGTVSIEIVSGDPTQNPILFFPYYLAAGVGILVTILLVTKKRS